MYENPFREGNLEGQLVIIAVGPSFLLVVRQGEADDPMAETQMYEMDRGEDGGFLEEIKPLGVWLKYMYGAEVINPILFTERERALRQGAYQSAKRAREAASGN